YLLFSLPFFSSPLPSPPRSTLFPYTTLFRSGAEIARAFRSERLFAGVGDAVLEDARAAFRAAAKRLLAAEIGRLFAITAVLSKVDRKSTRLNSSHVSISYAVFCLKKKTKIKI